MPIRLSGLNSGLDTEAIISQLVSAKSVKINSVKKQQTKLSWKQDAWKALNTKIVNLYNNQLGKMRFYSNYAKKTTKVSNSDAVSVVTGSGAVNGTQSLKVSQLAKTAYLTGGKVSGQSGALTANSKVSDIKGLDSCNGTIGLKIGTGDDAKTTNITINNETKISDVLSQLKKAGLNATFDEKNQRFFVSAKEAGAENNFAITSADENGAAILNGLGLSLSLDKDITTKTAYEKSAALLDGTADEVEAKINAEVDATIAKRLASYESKYKTANETIVKSDETIDKLKEKYTGEDGKTAFDDLKSVEEYDELIKNNDSRLKSLKLEMEQTERNLQSASAENKSQYIDKYNELKAEKDKLEADNEKYKSEKTDASSLADANKAKESAQADLDEIAANTDVTTDAVTGELTGITAKDSMRDTVKAEITQQATYAKEVLTKFEAGELKDGGATKIDGQDAMIVLNGAEFTSKNNTFEINGLTYNVMQETGDKEITVTTQDDTDGIYDMVKTFIKEYNTLINEMSKLYNAESAEKYSPLTAEEKDAMTDKEVEEWETKIKDSILRKDSNLSSIMDVLKNGMMSGVTVNGKKMYLSDFGIATKGYFGADANERNAYHIDGDADDASTATNADKLKTMIANDPDAVTTFFAELTRNLYSSMSTAMKSSSSRSAFNAYDDKKMKSDYDKFTSKISTLEDKLKDYEDRYYKQFSRMETAMAKLSSKQTALSGLFGTK